MAPYTDDYALNSLIADLSPKTVAVQSGTPEAIARAVVRALMGRVDQLVRSRRGPGQPNHFKLTTEALRVVLGSSNIKQLSAESEASDEEALRVLRAVTAVVNAAWAQVQQDTTQPWSHAFFAPLQAFARDGEILWPESIPEHAHQLQLAFQRFRHPNEPPRNDSVVMSSQDMRALQNGMVLLQHKISRAYGDILDEMSPHVRPKFAAESWYTSRQSREDALTKIEAAEGSKANAHPTLSNTQALSQAPRNGSSLRRLAQASSAPYLQVRGHITQPRFLGPFLQDNLPVPHSNTTALASNIASYIEPGHHRAAMFEQPPARKHDLPLSPGNSPINKKSRDESGSEALHNEKDNDKANATNTARKNGAYRMFVLAERGRIAEELAQNVLDFKGGVNGHEISSLMAELWSRMSADDKAPFAVAFEAEEREARPTQDVKHGFEQTSDTVERLRQLKELKRSRVVLSARTICEQLRSRSRTPKNSLTKAAAARCFSDTPVPTEHVPLHHAYPVMKAAAATTTTHLASNTLAVPLKGLRHPVPASASFREPVLLPPISVIKSSRRISMPLAYQTGNRSPLQSVSSSYVPQPQPQAQSQRTVDSARASNVNELLMQMKRNNAGLQQVISRSVSRSMTPNNFVDLTGEENDPPVPGMNKPGLTVKEGDRKVRPVSSRSEIGGKKMHEGEAARLRGMLAGVWR